MPAYFPLEDTPVIPVSSPGKKPQVEPSSHQFSYAEAVKHAAHHEEPADESKNTQASKYPAGDDLVVGAGDTEKDELEDMEIPSSESPVTDEDPPTDPLDSSPPVPLTADSEAERDVSEEKQGENDEKVNVA